MIPLFALSAALILYGTLYPFAAAEGAHWWSILPRFMESVEHLPGRGDALSNLVLFLPFGFFGMQAMLPRAPRFARLLLVCVLGGGLSFFVECSQTFIAGRDTSVFDLMLNTLGALVGACAGWTDWNQRLSDGVKSHRPTSIYPLLLIGAWLALRLFPYVPTLDFQHVKDAIKPLLTGEFLAVDVLRHFVICLIVGRLLQSMLSPNLARIAMPILVLGVIAAKPFLMTRVMSLSEVIGAGVAVGLWFAVHARAPIRTSLLAVLLGVQVTVQGIIPWIPADHPSAFSFIPFTGFESGSMAINLQSFLEKVFLYGSLIWLLVQSTMRLSHAVAVSVVLLIAIELVQTQLQGRVSEITDPLLAIIMGVVLYSLEQSRNTAPIPVRATDTAKFAIKRTYVERSRRSSSRMRKSA